MIEFLTRRGVVVVFMLSMILSLLFITLFGIHAMKDHRLLEKKRDTVTMVTHMVKLIPSNRKDTLIMYTDTFRVR